MSDVPANPAHITSIRKRESSINSLKELIIILTGLAITSALSVLFRGATTASQHLDTLSSTSLMTSARIQSIILLVLLFPCVLRFYHGNIMILDKYYLTEPWKRTNARNITLDFVSILGMSILLVAMGFSIHAPILYFFSFIAILSISIIWNAVNIFILSNIFNIDQKSSEFISIDRDKFYELKSQLIWLGNNVLFLFIFVWVFVVGVTLIFHNIYISINESQFYILASIIFANSAVDIIASWKDYFPRIMN